MNAADLMTRNVVTLSPGSSVRSAARLMVQRGISGLPVVDDEGHVAGLVTEGDLLRRVEPAVSADASARWHHWITPDGLVRDYIKSHSWCVADVMTSPVVTIEPETPLHDVAALMDARAIKRLPVVSGGRLVGIVSRSDLLRWIVEEPAAGAAHGDAAIGTMVRARLRDAQRILDTPPEVHVEDGIVQLEGQVHTEAERRMLHVLVEGVPGVRGLEDRLVLAGEGART